MYHYHNNTSCDDCLLFFLPLLRSLFFHMVSSHCLVSPHLNIQDAMLYFFQGRPGGNEAPWVHFPYKYLKFSLIVLKTSFAAYRAWDCTRMQSFGCLQWLSHLPCIHGFFWMSKYSTCVSQKGPKRKMQAAKKSCQCSECSGIWFSRAGKPCNTVGRCTKDHCLLCHSEIWSRNQQSEQTHSPAARWSGFFLPVLAPTGCLQADPGTWLQAYCQLRGWRQRIGHSNQDTS